MELDYLSYYKSFDGTISAKGADPSVRGVASNGTKLSSNVKIRCVNI